MPPLQRIRLTNRNNMQVELVDFGARIISIKVANVDQRIIEAIYGDTKDQDILSDASYKGATCGRVANRISNASYKLDGREVQLVANEGDNMLHGGAKGFSNRIWRIAEHRKRYSEDMAIFELHSGDNDQGFEGNMLARVTYRLLANNELRIEYSAVCDKLCPVNMCNHAYFNLGEGSISALALQVNALCTLETDKQSIPTGRYSGLTQRTELRQLRHLSDLLKAGDLDDCYVLTQANKFATDTSPSPVNETIARLISKQNGLALCIATDQLGLQVYTGNFLAHKHAAIALEAQGFPDALNHGALPSDWVGPNQPYRRYVSYRFEHY